MFETVLPKYINAKNIIFFIVIIMLIKLIINISDVAILFFASFVIACSLEPFVVILQKRFPKLKRSKACAITLIGAISGLLALFVPIIVIGSNEVRTFTVSFPQYIDSLKHFIITNHFLSKSTLGQIDVNGLISSASALSSRLFEETLNIGINLGSAFVYLIVSVLVIYYFMLDRDKVKCTTMRLFPKQMRKRVSEIYDSIAQKIGGYVVAQIATMASVGVIVTIGFLLLRIDYALLLGLICAVFDIIPVVGPTIALLICLVAVYKYGIWVLLLTAAVFGFAQLAENNFVRPFVFSKLMNIHPLVIFLFLLIAAKYMGIVGVVFAPAIAATVVVLVEELYMKSIE